MGEKYESPAVYCPYYKGESRNSTMIYCEGFRKGTVLHLAFDLPKDMRAYRNQHCCIKENLNKCLIYDMLDYNNYSWKEGE